MNILCLGDIVGSAGVDAVIRHLPQLIRDHAVDFVVANIENAAGGFGFTHRVYRQLLNVDIDAFTSGNHVYAKQDVLSNFDDFSVLVRPINFPDGHPGQGARVFTKNNRRIAIVNVLGRVFMPQLVSCPFKALDSYLESVDADIIIADIHAETTSEKQALGWYLNERVSICFGTHTHVQTNDCRLLSNKTGYITDLGMCGARDSVIGMDKDISIQKFLTQLPQRHRPVNSTEECLIGGMVVSIADDGMISAIQAFNEVVTV